MSAKLLDLLVVAGCFSVLGFVGFTVVFFLPGIFLFEWTDIEERAQLRFSGVLFVGIATALGLLLHRRILDPDRDPYMVSLAYYFGLAYVYALAFVLPISIIEGVRADRVIGLIMLTFVPSWSVACAVAFIALPMVCFTVRCARALRLRSQETLKPR